MKILFFLHNELIWKKYENDEDLVFFDLDNWHIHKDGQRKSLPFKFFYDEDFDGINSREFKIKSVLKKLRSHGPTLSRWTDKGDQFESYYRLAIKHIHIVFTTLKKLKIDYVIFPTSVSHHMDTLILEIASSEAKIKQIFLYNIFGEEYNGSIGRLLPLIQDKSIKDRRVIDFNVSKYDYTDSLKKIQNFNRSFSSSKNNFNLKSFVTYSLILLSKDLIKSKIKKLLINLSILKKTNKNKIGDFPIYKFSTHYNQMKNQKDGLKYYKEKCITNKAIDLLKKNNNIVIAAHFQPEATSFPEGGPLFNHIDIVYQLIEKKFKGNILYKEHPASNIMYEDYVGPTRVGMLRSIEYYKHLEELGCLFLDTSFHLALDDSSNWYLPITITGSISHERSLNGYYTITSGKHHWGQIPGTIPLQLIKSFASFDFSKYQYNEKIKNESFDYLTGLVSNKTIINGLGIGSGNKDLSKEINDNFVTEFENLIGTLKNLR